MTRGIHSFFTFLACILLDWGWIHSIAHNLMNYRAAAFFQPGDLLFYCLILFLLLTESVYPALYKRTPVIALYYGALTGFVAFGIYEFISSFWYSNYPLTLAVADTVWGVFMCTVLGWFSYLIGRSMHMSGSAEKDVAMDRGMFLE